MKSEHPRDSGVHSSTIDSSQAIDWINVKCLLTDERKMQKCYTYMMEYYSALKDNEVPSFITTCMDPGDH